MIKFSHKENLTHTIYSSVPFNGIWYNHYSLVYFIIRNEIFFKDIGKV